MSQQHDDTQEYKQLVTFLAEVSKVTSMTEKDGTPLPQYVPEPPSTTQIEKNK